MQEARATRCAADICITPILFCRSRLALLSAASAIFFDAIASASRYSYFLSFRLAAANVAHELCGVIRPHFGI